MDMVLRVTESCMMSEQILSSSIYSGFAFMVGVDFHAILFTMPAYEVLVPVDVVLTEEAEEKLLVAKESSKN